MCAPEDPTWGPFQVSVPVLGVCLSVVESFSLCLSLPVSTSLQLSFSFSLSLSLPRPHAISGDLCL